MQLPTLCELLLPVLWGGLEHREFLWCFPMHHCIQLNSKTALYESWTNISHYNMYLQLFVWQRDWLELQIPLSRATTSIFMWKLKHWFYKLWSQNVLRFLIPVHTYKKTLWKSVFVFVCFGIFEYYFRSLLPKTFFFLSPLIGGF